MGEQIERLRDEIKTWEDWSNSIAEQMPEHYDGDEAQEAIIDRWISDLRERGDAAEQLAEAADTLASFAGSLAIAPGERISELTTEAVAKVRAALAAFSAPRTPEGTDDGD